ncbi:MAG: hypothetical protein ACRDDM_10470 [Paraclostridium sp.]
MEELEQLKLRLREESSPFFTDKELEYYLDLYNKDLDLTTYKLLIMKAEDDSITLPGGLSLANNRKYWLTLASNYKPNGSRCL